MIEIVDVEDADALAAVTTAILDDHARAAGHPFDPRPLAFAARLDGERVAGVYAAVLHGWVMVKYLAVAPAHRGRGVATALMRRLEAAAVAMGAIGVFVDTYGFQAPAFYARLGFDEIGQLPTPDPARTRIFFRKVLAAPSG